MSAKLEMTKQSYAKPNKKNADPFSYKSQSQLAQWVGGRDLGSCRGDVIPRMTSSPQPLEQRILLDYSLSSLELQMLWLGDAKIGFVW